MRFDETIFTVIDVETTGLFPYSGDKICEIAALKVEPDGSMSRFESLVDPERPISPEAFSVNGITPEMVEGQPKVDEVLPDFMDFIKGSVLVAYNASFDLGFLECALGEGKKALGDFQAIDALRLARRLFPGLKRYNLLNVAQTLHIYPTVEHRAMADVLTTWEVFEAELETLRQQGIETVESIAHRILVSKRLRGMEQPRTVAALIRAAIRTGNPVCIKYQSIWNERVTQRTITPISIHSGYESPYVVAYCHMRRERRTFHLNGILEAVPEPQNTAETSDEI